jgi:hypothetical protein
MSISTDNVEMSNVVGTGEGRIMMSGNQDGNLYELHYQEAESWFGKRVKLINHSIGGVQSLLPKFSSQKSEGECLVFLITHWKLYIIQTELCRSSLTPRETCSTPYTTTTSSQYTPPHSIHNQFNKSRLYQTSSSQPPKKPQGLQLSHRRTFTSYRCMLSITTSHEAATGCSL